MKLLGLMSGTSLDGMDAALLEVGEGEGRVEWRLLAFRTQAYTESERERVRKAIHSGGPRELALLHTDLGSWFGRAALALLEEAGVDPASVAALGSHGQTIWHEPPTEAARGSSLQLGCPHTLAEITGIPVVSDFRARDLAAGGHGAPLVPWADRILFSSREGPRVIQNLGGMGNVTWLPPAGRDTPLLAFDTGPGVVLLDAAAVLATGGALTFDQEGRLARQGEVVEELLEGLLDHPFFDEEPPRSTGRETFGPQVVEEAAGWLRRERGAELTPASPQEGWPDLMATLTALTARSVADAYRRWVIPRGADEVFLMGGGARNPALRNALAAELPVPLRDGAELGMDPDAREAAAFALLAWARLRSVPANVPEATGSDGPRVLGSLTPGRSP